MEVSGRVGKVDKLIGGVCVLAIGGAIAQATAQPTVFLPEIGYLEPSTCAKIATFAAFKGQFRGLSAKGIAVISLDGTYWDGDATIKFLRIMPVRDNHVALVLGRSNKGRTRLAHFWLVKLADGRILYSDPTRKSHIVFMTCTPSGN